MARSRQEGRLDEILEAAARVFMRLGYRGARIDLVAQEAGIAAGTVHLYAASKEALFDLVMRREFGAPIPNTRGPYALESSATMINDAWEHLAHIAQFTKLDAALAQDVPTDPQDELRGIVHELYRWIATYWRGLRIVERCASEWPELHALFYQQLRRPQLARFATYLERRARQGLMRSTPNSATAARVVLEMIAFFAMHRHTAPDSQDLNGDVAEQTVIDMVLASLRVTETSTSLTTDALHTSIHSPAR